ncbi:MAG: MATE family efflux transporter, partial [Pseudomonadota bacterium]
FGIGLPLYAAGMVLTQSINGAGDTRTPTILNLIAFWILQIPLAMWLAHSLELGPRGVLIAIVIAESLLSVAAIAVFRHGRWQHTSV